MPPLPVTDNRNYYLDTLDYGNGDSIQYEYDNVGRVTKQTYEDGETVSYQYDNNGALATVTDSETGIKTTYYYDFTDRMMKYVESGTDYSHSVGYEYDQLNNLTKIVDTLNGTTRETSYSYDEDNRIESVSTGDSSANYSYDGFGRVSQEQTKDGENVVLTDSYTFTPNGSNTSTQVATHTIDATGFDATYTYTYDDNGNILSVSDGTYTTSYVYDSQNQLLRENNQKANKTWTWSYNNGGNIRSKSVYAYTTGTLGTATDTVTYTYGDSNWRDLLTSYDGRTITYDGVGNLLNDGEWTYTWKHGRQLASMVGTYGCNWDYTYNADGLRIARSSTDWAGAYKYHYSGDKLVRLELWEEFGLESIDGYMDFSYDANGIPVSANYYLRLYETEDFYDGTDGYDDVVLSEEFYNGTFYYVTNLQGDVIALVDETGDLIAEYTYDAWGKPLQTQYYTDFHYIAYYNPLRYRGYVYDQETGLYYLQSRYYDPEIGRFINADAFVTTGQGVLGNNMFTYCLNNPVIYADEQGYAAIVLLDKNFPTHIGIMAQDENGTWWHYYWGTASGKSRIICMFGLNVTPVTWCEVYSGKLTLTDINASGQFSGNYENMMYFTGDFSECVEEMKNSSGKYNLYWNNCSQKSLEILSVAETEYRFLFTTAAIYKVPSDAYKYLEFVTTAASKINKMNINILLPKKPISFPVIGGSNASSL